MSTAWGLFKLPLLPKEFYEAMEELRKEFKISQWHVILVAIQALIYLSEEQPKLVQAWMLKVREKYPFPRKFKVD